MPYRYVFQVKVRPGEDEAFIANWKGASQPTQEYPGARGTRMHKKLGEDHTYIAIAEWESREAREAAMRDIEDGQSDLAKRVNAWRSNKEFGELKVIAHLDQIESVLL